MPRRLLVLCVALPACGRVGFAPVSDAGPPGPGRDAQVDASVVRYRDTVMADTPLAYYRLDDLDLIARDELDRFAGTYTAGCARGAAGALAGDADTAVQLDGSTCTVSFGDVLAFDGVAPFSIELWASVAPSPGLQVLFMNESRDASGPIAGYSLVQSPTGVFFERAVAHSNFTTPAAVIPAATWVHLVATYDGTTSRMYVNGTMAASRIDGRAIPAYTAPARLGVNTLEADWLTGSIDEVAVYDHVLPVADILRHYDIGASGPVTGDH